MRLVTLCAVLLCFVVPSTALNNKEMAKFLQQFMGTLPAVPLPDVTYDHTGLHANATKMTVSKLNLTGFALTIPDPEHMQFSLSGMTASLNMELIASIIGIHRTQNITGAISDLDVKVTFAVAAGNAVMSNVDLNIGGLSVNFGDDKLATLLSKLFLPVLRHGINLFLPTAILHMYKDEITFQHLMTNILTSLTSTHLPNTTLADMGYTLELTGVSLDEIKASNQAFSIQNINQLNFDMAGLVGSGSMKFRYGQDGGEMHDAEAKLGLFDTHINIVTEIVSDGSGGFNMNYVSAYQNISHLSIATTDPSPVIQFLVNAINPLLKSLLEQGFTFLVRAFLAI